MKNYEQKLDGFMDSLGKFAWYLLVASIAYIFGMGQLYFETNTPAKAKAHYERMLEEERQRHGEAMGGDP